VEGAEARQGFGHDTGRVAGRPADQSLDRIRVQTEALVTRSRTDVRRIANTATTTTTTDSTSPAPPARTAQMLPETMAPREMTTRKAALETMPARMSAQPATLGAAPRATSRR
jgi:hypothetical protein